MKKEELLKFINESLTDENQFNVCHELYGHCLAEHTLSLPELQNKLWDSPKATISNPIVAASRFYSANAARKIIHQTLIENVDSILQWRKKLYLNILVIEKDFSDSIGEAIIKGADRNTLIPFHRLTLVLCNGDQIGQPFFIKIAYPAQNFDDIDNCYDAIDEFQEKRKRKCLK